MTIISRTEVCLHCGGRLFWDDEEKEPRCINCARTPDSDNHNGEAESPQSTVKQKRLHHRTESTSSTEKLVKIAQASEVRVPAPAKPSRSLKVVTDKDWYAPYEITFHSRHMLFLIKHLELLREGVYPHDPYHSGYTDEPMPKKRRRTSHHAYFETPCQLASEVERRLENCGLDGIMLLLLYTYNWSEEIIAKYYRISVEEVKFRAEAVLKHISGWNYKARPYRRWHAVRNYQTWARQHEVKVV